MLIVSTYCNALTPLRLCHRIAPLPKNCTSTHIVNQGSTELMETDCVRGDNAYIYQWAFFFAMLWATILFCLLAMFLNFMHVYQTEARTMQYRRRWSVAPVMTMTNEFKKQSLLYVSGTTHVFSFYLLRAILILFLLV